VVSSRNTRSIYQQAGASAAPARAAVPELSVTIDRRLDWRHRIRKIQRTRVLMLDQQKNEVPLRDLLRKLTAGMRTPFTISHSS